MYIVLHRQQEPYEVWDGGRFSFPSFSCRVGGCFFAVGSIFEPQLSKKELFWWEETTLVIHHPLIESSILPYFFARSKSCDTIVSANLTFELLSMLKPRGYNISFRGENYSLQSTELERVGDLFLQNRSFVGSVYSSGPVFRIQNWKTLLFDVLL